MPSIDDPPRSCKPRRNARTDISLSPIGGEGKGEGRFILFG